MCWGSLSSHQNGVERRLGFGRQSKSAFGARLPSLSCAKSKSLVNNIKYANGQTETHKKINKREEIKGKITFFNLFWDLNFGKILV